jgi:hypothetical protein
MAPKPSLTPVPPPSVPQSVTPSYGGAPAAKLSPPKGSDKSFLGKVKENVLRVSPVTAGVLGGGKALQAVTGKLSEDQGVIGYPARELQAAGKIIENVPQGFITFAGGMGVDAAQAVASSLTLGKYRPAYGTSISMIKSMGHTLELFTGQRELEYWDALKNKQAISHLLLEDAGNIFFLGKGISSVFGGKGGLGQVKTDNVVTGIRKVSTDKSLPIYERYVPEFKTVQSGGGLKGKFGEKATAATEAGAEVAAKRWGQLESASLKIGESTGYLAQRGEQLMQLPFKPYVKAFQYAGYSYRTGSLLGKEWGAWGKSAADKYKAQLIEYKAANPDLPMYDPFIKELSKKIAFHENNAISSQVKKAINKAARMELFDKESTKRIILGIKTEPLYKKDINVDTGKEWGELSPAEEQAVIASINGRAQLVRWLSETLGMEPKQVALIGRVNNRPEMHLGPDGATLGVDFLNHTSQNPRMSSAQYERLADAVERLAVQSAHATQRAVDGWGRKNNLSAEYLTPTPFVKNLGINLKKWGNKEALDFFNAAAEKGIWDLPVDDIHRINTLMAIVEILPDEFALDASMYPASMRENVAFYRRVRAKLGRELIGDATGAPMPPDNQPAVGPDVYPMTRKSGKLTAASDLLSSVRSKIEKTIANVEKINNRIAKLEEAHKASADKLRTYDIIDAHLNGVSQKVIAKKYKMTVADVNKFLKSKEVVRAFEALKASEARISALEDTIGKKRSAMDEGASSLELEKMQEQLAEFRRIANEAQLELDSAQNVNEAARRMEEESNSKLAEEIYNSDDELFDAETAFIEAGGDPAYLDIPDDILDPANAPITVGSGRTYYEGLTDYIDEVLAPMAKEVSPAMEADVARIKVLLSESWNMAETNYYNSPTEIIAAVNQARVIQLGELMRDLALNADTPGNMIQKTIRDKVNLDILSGVTSPFEVPKRGNGKILAEGQKPLPAPAVNSKTVRYEGEQLPRLDPSTDYKQQLLDMAAEVEFPGTYKTATWRKPKEQVDVSKNVNIDYEQFGYPANLDIEYKTDGTISTARLQYETWTYNNDRQGANTGRTAIEIDLPSGQSVVEQVSGPDYKYPDSPQSLDSVLVAIDEAMAAWNLYKQDPFNNTLDDIYEGIHEINGIELNTELSLNEGNIRFEWPQMDNVPKTAAGKAKAMKAIAEFDAEMVKFKKFIDEMFGSSRATKEAGLLPVPKKIETPRIEDAIGAIELSPEFEARAKEAVDNPEVLKQLRDEYEDVLALEKDIEAVSNPTPADIKAYREQQIKFYEDEIYTQSGYAQSNLGAGVDVRTGNPTWGISPKKGQPEWDWWFKGLDAKQRQVIARDFFRTTEFKSGSFSGPRYVREGTAIDGFADEANMTVDEFGAAILENIDRIQKARRSIRNTKATDAAVLGDEFTKINLEELQNYQSRYDLTADEYGAIVARAEHLSGLEANPRTVELLRPTAKRPAEVVEDMAITDPVIRQATYEADVLKAMAKDAAAKMKKAERLSDRIAAFDQWIKDSAQYKKEALDLIERRKTSQNKRLVQAKREAKLRELKTLRKTEELKVRRMEKTEAKLISSVPNQRLSLLPGSGPLKVALDENIMYPSGNFDVGYTDLEGSAASALMRGPMYLPSGGNMLMSGGLKREYSAEGTTGNVVLRNEHYRAGDRETVFSLRLIATRLGEESGQMSANESFRAVVSLFGKKPVELLDDVTIERLREESKTEALAYSKETATAFYPDLVKAMDEAGTPVPDGMGAYAPGVMDPAANLKFMEDQLFGAKILSEMQNQGLKPVDPYAKIEKSIPFDKINEETFFLPEGMKEKIARENKIVTPNFGTRLLSASQFITAKFKTTTLAFSVTWQLGDLISNTIISQMSGVDAVTLYKRMQQVGSAEYGSVKALVDPLTPMGNGKTLEQQRLAEFLQASPVQNVSLQQQERFTELGLAAPEPKKSLLRRAGEQAGIPEKLLDRNPVRVSFKVNETLNTIQRHAYFLELMDRAIKEKFGSRQTLENIIDDGTWRTDRVIHDLMFEVADTANKWLGDFADLTMKERKYVTQFVPFYAWIKHVHKVFWALAKERPQALAWYFYLGSLGFDPEEDPMNLKYGGTSLFGGVLSTNFLNPLSDVLNGPLAYLYGGDKRNALRGQGPVPRLVGALAFGTDTTTLSPIQRAPGAGGYSPSGSALNSGLLLPNGGSLSEALGFAIQQFPLANRLVQASPVRGNIPGTRIALGPVATYKTGEARLSPQTNQRIEKWGGTPASIGRLFSLPGIPYQTDKQIASVERAARARLKTVETMKRRRANSEAP